MKDSNSFVITASILFWAVAIVWSKDTWLNTLIKLLFFFLAAWGSGLSLIALGVIFVKP